MVHALGEIIKRLPDDFKKALCGAFLFSHIETLPWHLQGLIAQDLANSEFEFHAAAVGNDLRIFGTEGRNNRHLTLSIRRFSQSEKYRVIPSFGQLDADKVPIGRAGNRLALKPFD